MKCKDFPDRDCIIASGCMARAECWRTEDARLGQRPIDQIMAEMPEQWRMNWCEPGSSGCGCIGCANMSGGLSRWGFTKAQWEEWKQSK